MRNIVALMGLVIVLGFVNWSILGKEQHLADGDVVYLKLAPIDPRSLMQGDYMALRFAMADAVYEALPKADDSKRWRQQVEAPDGKVVVSIDDKNVASFRRIHGDEVLAAAEKLIKYRVRNSQVKFATNAFFFEEGQGSVYESALYGQFRVDSDGELLLVAMYDKDLNELAP